MMPSASQHYQNKGTVEDVTVHIVNRWQDQGRNRPGPQGSAGSGTCIWWVYGDYKAALILTCCHLFTARGDPQGRQLLGPIEVKFPDGRQYTGRLLDMDRGGDLALLTIDHHAELACTAVAETTPRTGETLWHVGYPLGKGPRVQSGLCVGVSDITRIRCRFQSGDSGGGIFSQDGKLVGVVSGFYSNQPNVGNGAALPRIRKFIAACLPGQDRSGHGGQFGIGIGIFGRRNPSPASPTPPVAGPGSGASPPPASAPYPPAVAAPFGAAGRDVDVLAILAELKNLRGQIDELAKLKGQPGPAGASGPGGPAGKDGERGADGLAGGRGIAGSVGLPGPMGPAGVAGPAGKDADTAALPGVAV